MNRKQFITSLFAVPLLKLESTKENKIEKVKNPNKIFKSPSPKRIVHPEPKGNLRKFKLASHTLSFSKYNNLSIDFEAIDNTGNILKGDLKFPIDAMKIFCNAEEILFNKDNSCIYINGTAIPLNEWSVFTPCRI